MRSIALVIIVAFTAYVGTDAFAQSPTEKLLPSQYTYLADYETEVLFPWISEFEYTRIEGWEKDKEVRNTGPFVYQKNFGTHPAVRIWYSPEMVQWLDEGRPDGGVPDGAMIIKEMFPPPAQIYNQVEDTAYFAENSADYQQFLERSIESWTIMIKDSGGHSADGWFWGQVGPNHAFDPKKKVAPSNLPYDTSYTDNYEHPIYSGFGTGTCIRCHASAQVESTFISLDNIDPERHSLQFKVDNSWRSESYLDPKNDKGKSTKPLINLLTNNANFPNDQRERLFDSWFLEPSQRPWTDDNYEGYSNFVKDHTPAADEFAEEIDAEKPILNTDFTDAFSSLTKLVQPSASQIEKFSFPPAFADHVYPSDHPQEYITASNCLGCHGGLGGAPSGVAQFVQTGPAYGEGYNISPFGEWRWSPMGLAGRDPIFHSQIETELIILLKDANALNSDAHGEVEASVRDTQQGLVDTCLRCHGAMGLRQKGIDGGHSMDLTSTTEIESTDPVQNWITDKHQDILNPGFDINDFYRTTALSKKDKPFIPWKNLPLPAPPASHNSDEWGNLAREGISCAVCHHIAPPTQQDSMDWTQLVKEFNPDWITSKGQLWGPEFFTFLGTNNTGLYERSEADLILGPLDDVIEKPMEHAMAITPKVAPLFATGRETPIPFTKDSAMCGTCHTINLPNIGATEDEYPVLTALEPNPLFQGIPHSIEQATYLEWLNSKFGPGKYNEQGEEFASCQDCHMPNRFAIPTPEGGERYVIDPLSEQIATIQDSDYAVADYQLNASDLEVPTRSDYSRHELVGLNGFMIEMFRQFEPVLGVDKFDPETYATNGPELAIENMVLSTQSGRVATVNLSNMKQSAEALSVDVTVANKTGHRLPSGAAFRRVWIELLVKDEHGEVLWGSGRTNDAGFIIGENGKRLVTEFLQDPDLYQKHYTTINNQNQVQIYEELIKNAEGEFTTSFVHRVHHVKDNRLLPEGWVPAAEFAGKSKDAGISDQGELLFEFMKSTDPGGLATKDVEFMKSPSDGSDTLTYEIDLNAIEGTPATVEATLYSQSFQPSWFWQRFSLANEAKAAGFETPATDRLFYLASNLNLDKTPMEQWKFKVAKDAVKLK
jgi:cytochrome c553